MAGLKQYFLDNPPFEYLSRQSETSGVGANAAFVAYNTEDLPAQVLHEKMSDPLPYFGGDINGSNYQSDL